MVGVKIRDLRKKLGLTQEQLAGTELTKSYVSQVELGRIHPSHKALAIIAQRLGKPLGYFVENGDDMRTIDVLLRAVQALWNTGRLEDGMLGLQEAYTLAARTGRDDTLARIKATMGRMEMTQGNLSAALAHLEESLSMIHPDENPIQAVEIATTLGMVAARSGSFHKAMNSFQQSLEYARRLPDRAADIRAESSLHYGDFCYSQREWISALELYREALVDSEHLISQGRQAELYGRIASTEWQLGHKEQALAAIDQALARVSQVTQFDERATIEGDLGRVLLATGRHHEAHQLLVQSLEVFDRLHFQEGQAVLLEALLELAASQPSLEWLTQYSDRVLRADNLWPWIRVKVYALRLLARRSVRAGELPVARDYLTQALALASADTRHEIECENYLVRAQLGDTEAIEKLWTHVVGPMLKKSQPHQFTPRLPKISSPPLSLIGSIS